MITRRFDHIDLRVRNLAECRAFYQRLLPALGFTKDAQIEGWLQFERAEGATPEFFGVTESTNHQPNQNRIAFWAENNGEVNALARLIKEAGAQNIEGPLYEDPGYYAVFFEDPSGNRLEICHREQTVI